MLLLLELEGLILFLILDGAWDVGRVLPCVAASAAAAIAWSPAPTSSDVAAAAADGIGRLLQLG